MSAPCCCKRERAFYRDASGRTREARGGVRWLCATHAKDERAKDTATWAFLARWFPPTRLALPAPEGAS